jgi:D-glycero-D-manno-heptose 1,7-bisphosphate phosphatase
MGTDNRGGRRAVFLDRDGVINRNVWNPATLEYESPLTVDAFELVPGVLSALAELRRAGYLIFLVSNQPNYAKQKVSMEILDAIHQKLIAATARAGIAWAACYYCFHHPEGSMQGYSGPCVCRKPSPYFLFRARRDFGLELSLSWMIGDRESDVQCGRAAGTRTILIADGEAGGVVVTADHRAVDLAQAVRLISGC